MSDYSALAPVTISGMVTLPSEWLDLAQGPDKWIGKVVCSVRDKDGNPVANIGVEGRWTTDHTSVGNTDEDGNVVLWRAFPKQTESDSILIVDIGNETSGYVSGSDSASVTRPPKK